MPVATGNEVWGEPLSVNRQLGIMSVLFATTPHLARDPITLSRWSCHARFVAMGKIPPRTAPQHAIYQWLMGQSAIGRVVPLARQAETGIDLWGADVPLDDRVLGPQYCEEDHNGSFVWIGFQGQWPVVLGPVGDNAVALERLAGLYRLGGRPAMAARVQANRRLYGPDDYGSAGLVVVTFDPGFPPDELDALAVTLYDLKDADDEQLPAALIGTRAAVLENEECWFYHRRVRLPPDLARGRPAFLSDIWIHRQHLADRYFSERQPRLLPVLAQPDETGGVELIPYDRIGQFWSGPQAAAFALRSSTGS